MPQPNSLVRETDRNTGASWYALYTRHQHEKAVAQTLTAKGFEVFLPLYSTAHRWQDRTKQLSLPLFPGYVFVRTGLDRRVRALATPGVHHFVPRADRPVPIPLTEIESVRELTQRTGLVEPHPFLKTGGWVRVRTGPLEGMEGIIRRWKGAFRLVISVELLQQSVAVEIDLSMVEKQVRRFPEQRCASPLRYAS